MILGHVVASFQAASQIFVGPTWNTFESQLSGARPPLRANCQTIALLPSGLATFVDWLARFSSGLADLLFLVNEMPEGGIS